MSSIRKRTTKGGQVFYEIRCRVSRDRPELCTRWYPQQGWSKKAIDKELAKQAAEFERQCKAGEVLSRSEQKEKNAKHEKAIAAIQTLKEYGEQVFMPAKTITCSENTRSNFQSILDNHIYPVLGDLKLPEISNAQISAFLLNVQSQGKAHSTCVKIYTVLGLLFKMAYMNDTIERNPMDKVERPKQRKGEKKNDEVEAYTAEELKYIMDCLETESLKWQAYVYLLIYTGIRRGEACGLLWRNVDFKANTITIEQSLNYTVSKGVYIDTPKNGKTRSISVDPFVIEILRKWRVAQATQAISPYVFSQEYSAEPMNPTSPTHFMAQFAKRHGIEKMHPHKLRHSFASIAITNGADIASVSEILGHSDKAVTLRVYSHADKESQKRAAGIFSNALKETQNG